MLLILISWAGKDIRRLPPILTVMDLPTRRSIIMEIGILNFRNQVIRKNPKPVIWAGKDIRRWSPILTAMVLPIMLFFRLRHGHGKSGFQQAAILP